MSTNEGPRETTLLDYECADCEFKWTEVMREEYGHCDEDCPRCGARPMSPTEREVPKHADGTLLQAMLTACQSLDTAYANGADGESIDWSELHDAARLARAALLLAELKGLPCPPRRPTRA